MTQVSVSSILFLSKTTDWCKAAQRFMLKHFRNVTILEGERSTQFPDTAKNWQGDYIISFLSAWVIPQAILSSARKAAINFHPAPPEYPGIGCYNFALYDEANEFGVICHRMAAKVDSGSIVKVVRFPLFPTDSVESLKDRTMAYLLTLFYEIGALIAQGQELPLSPEVWQRQPYTRKELDALCRITPDMPEDEIRRRIRATFYPGYPGPYVELAGHRFAV